MDSDLFDSYEVDFQQLSSSIGAKLSTEVRELKGGQSSSPFPLAAPGLTWRVQNRVKRFSDVLRTSWRKRMRLYEFDHRSALE